MHALVNNAWTFLRPNKKLATGDDDTSSDKYLQLLADSNALFNHHLAPSSVPMWLPENTLRSPHDSLAGTRSYLAFQSNTPETLTAIQKVSL